MSERSSLVLITALTGGLLAFQAPINSRLGKSVGTVQGALVSFAVGTVVLLAIAVLVHGGLERVGQARHLPWYYLMGGVLGAIYVSVVLVTVRTLGAGGVTAATITGQLAASVAVDHFGWLGVQRDPVNVGKVGGVLLLAAGVALIVRS